jgi:EAL domain-containing protein (putative c-di-GMP-specific phosphodiesterase class I)
VRPRRPEWPGLILEVTESEAMAAFDLVCDSAVQLRIYDIDLAIDDFGAGYSSFARLKALPFRELKLDRSYVRNCGSDPFNGALCRSIIELAHASGALAVAEGVETEEERDALRRMGCDLGQGFLFARPLSVGNLIRMVVGEGHPQRQAMLARAGGT